MDGLELLFVVLSVGMIAIAIPLLLRRVRPNLWYGFRVKATLSDEQIWYEVNAYAARWLVALGVLGVIAAVGLAFVPGITVDAYAWAFLVIFGVGLAVSLVASFRHLRRIESALKDPKVSHVEQSSTDPSGFVWLEDASQPRVEGVAETVADEIESGNGDQNG